MAYCCRRSVILMCVMPLFSCMRLSPCVTFPLPGPPKTNTTGTRGLSNLTWLSLAKGNCPSGGVRSPRPSAHARPSSPAAASFCCSKILNEFFIKVTIYYKIKSLNEDLLSIFQLANLIVKHRRLPLGKYPQRNASSH